MDSTVAIPSDKQLRCYLGFLSKCMTGNLVQRMSNCLSRSRTIMAYEAQVITSQPTDMQKASRLMQIVLKKGQKACSAFLSCLGICDPVLYEKVTGFPAQFKQEDHQHFEEIPFSEKYQFTPCIINIQNSSLTNCIIGNNNSQCITCDQHNLFTQNDANNVNEVADSQSHDQRIPVQDTLSGNSIHMERSNIEYVIIGDRNSMTVTETSEDEEDTEIESEVIS
ncbi:uncharacterized protein LOC128030011 isoform X1 [Carassius gibelio]|uniref:uncharacterized protein LOC128030011 isoform X1 n=2 Tax=Carassius gibelio TaxID=101364 RepID=UPI0022775C82|nr:uncharacterized protein LOC128030011 isoform X1 [Carassius gibelio]XP_052473425.1 uncharacterized protein LOC128030011 isoform X1 [Carassius gibelio]